MGHFFIPPRTVGLGRGQPGGLRTSGSLRSRGDTEGDTCSGALPPPWAAAGWGHPQFWGPPKLWGCPQPCATCSRGAGAVTSAVPTGDRGPQHHQGTVEHSAPSHQSCHLPVGPILPPATPPMSPHPSWRGRGASTQGPRRAAWPRQEPGSGAGSASPPLCPQQRNSAKRAAVTSRRQRDAPAPPPQPARIN